MGPLAVLVAIGIEFFGHVRGMEACDDILSADECARVCCFCLLSFLLPPRNSFTWLYYKTFTFTIRLLFSGVVDGLTQCIICHSLPRTEVAIPLLRQRHTCALAALKPVKFLVQPRR